MNAWSTAVDTARGLLAPLPEVPLDEVVHQDRDVLAPLAQRRQVDRDDVEPVEEVVAELPLGDQRAQVALAARDDPDVDRNLPRPAEPLDRRGSAAPAAASPACVSGTSSMSSRKIVPPCASSNRPGRSLIAPVKAPRSWPNSSDSISVSERMAQLTGTNGLCRRRAGLVDEVGDQLLAGAGLAGDQHAAVAVGDHRARSRRPRACAHCDRRRPSLW